MIKIDELRAALYGRVFYRNASMQAIPKLQQEQTRAEGDVPIVETNNDTHTFILISSDNATERYDWWEGETFIEELDLKGADHSPLRTFFVDHRPSVENAIGKVDNKREESGQLLADITYASDERSQLVKLKYDEEILTDVSIGYRIDEIVETKNKDAPNHVLVTKFTIVELSAVWKGADSGAEKVKSVDENSGGEGQEKRFSLELYQKKQKLNEGRM